MRISDWSSDVCSSDLNGRFYGKQAARPGAHNLAPHVGQGPRKRIGPKRDRGHVAADEDARHAATCDAMRSSAASSIRATVGPSTSAFGPIAQRPRQYTGSRPIVTSPRLSPIPHPHPSPAASLLPPPPPPPKPSP